MTEKNDFTDDQPEKRQERRSSTTQLIENMLSERKQLLAIWLQASNLEPVNLEQEDNELLEELCQVLVDYIAAGHFGLYERIAGGKERRRAVAETAQNVYPQIENTTQLALDFSEKYNAENEEKLFASLSFDLSNLGEMLSLRMELEDQLITRMLS